MMTISVEQGIRFWHELEECYYDDNHFASDEAEIYAYTLAPNRPSGMRSEDYDNASRAVTELGNLFMHVKDCKILVDDQPMFEGGNINLIFSKSRHRVHLKVIKPVDYFKYPYNWRMK